MGRERARGAAPRPGWLGARARVLALLVIGGAWAFWQSGIRPADLLPHEGGAHLAWSFLERALSPALHSEADFVPQGTPPLLLLAGEAALNTLVVAGAAMSLAIAIGIVMGFGASTAWWIGDPAGARSRGGRWLRRSAGPLLYGSCRVLIALMRSIHEIIWAVLFLTAFGLSSIAAVLAIAIPYGGTLAKIFSEMVDETPRDAAEALRGLGASGGQVFFYGLVTRALPDMIAYAFYRFECALRSSAVLGFFGFPTLGLYIGQSFNSLNYGEVWTFLYALIVMVVVFDWWSGAVRRRIVA